MKRFTTFALVGTLLAGGLFACSSGDDDDSSGGQAGAKTTGGSGTAGTPSTAGTPATGGTGVINTQGGSAGSGTSGSSTTAGSGGTGNTTGGNGAGGNTTGGTGGGASGGSGGSGDNPNAVTSTCAQQMYTPAATPGGGGACMTTVVPAAKLIADFETAATGWGVYPNVDGMTGFTPNMATPSAGGANGTTKALAFTVANLAQGIKIQVGFGKQCQDVRTFKGLSFWAKGTIDAATMPYAVDANTIVLQVGSETSNLGGCMGGTCSAAPPDKRITISADWKEYRIPWDCFGDAKVFDGYYTNILFSAFGTNSNFAIDQVGYY